MIEAGRFHISGPRGTAASPSITALPCSFLTPLINGVIGGPRRWDYVGDASEVEGRSHRLPAPGFAGRGPVCVELPAPRPHGHPADLDSRAVPHPTLLFVPGAASPASKDERSSRRQGEVTDDLARRHPHRHGGIFPDDLREAVAGRCSHGLWRRWRSANCPFAFVMRQGQVRDTGGPARPATGQRQGKGAAQRTMSRAALRPSPHRRLERIARRRGRMRPPSSPPGKTPGREPLSGFRPRAASYQVGSVGCGQRYGAGRSASITKAQRWWSSTVTAPRLMKLRHARHP